jgi:hypothetical protein
MTGQGEHASQGVLLAHHRLLGLTYHSCSGLLTCAAHARPGPSLAVRLCSYSHWVKRSGQLPQPTGDACAFADVITYYYFKGTGFADR